MFKLTRINIFKFASNLINRIVIVEFHYGVNEVSKLYTHT